MIKNYISNNDIVTMQQNFQDGVDSIYNACVAKGSTPASTSLSDVVAGIMAIPTGITPSGTLSITANGTKDVTQYASVNVNVPNSNSGTYTASSSSTKLDMGATNTYRYVNTSALTKVSGTKSITANGNSQDVKSYQYVNVSVPNSNSGTYTYASGSTGGKVDMGATNTYRYVNATNVYAKGKSDGAASGTGGVTQYWCFSKIRTIMSTFDVSHSFAAGTWAIICAWQCSSPSWTTTGVTVNTVFNQGGLQIYSCYKASAYGCTFTKQSGGISFSFILQYP